MVTFTCWHSQVKPTHCILKLGPILDHKTLITSEIIMSWLKCDSKFNFIRLCKYQCGVGVFFFDNSWVWVVENKKFKELFGSSFLIFKRFKESFMSRS
jgi:hypothetical protein